MNSRTIYRISTIMSIKSGLRISCDHDDQRHFQDQGYFEDLDHSDYQKQCEN